jgi:hypothetical protein
MPYLRPLSRPIKDLSALSMGQDWNSPDNSTPSSFNDLANQFKAIDESGWVASRANSQNIGGRLRPLCGDYGPSFTHTASQVAEIDFELPQIFTKFCLVVYCRAFSARHYIQAQLQIERPIGTFTTQLIMFESGNIGSLGTAARPFLNYGTLQAPFFAGSGVEDAKLILTSTKLSPFGGSSATSMGNYYWDGFSSVELKLFR